MFVYESFLLAFHKKNITVGWGNRYDKILKCNYFSEIIWYKYGRKKYGASIKVSKAFYKNWKGIFFVKGGLS